MRSRTRWKFFGILAAVVVLGAVGLCLWESKPPRRKEFIGQVDPVSGYRCRFTLSSEWREDKPEKGSDLLSIDYFCPPVPNLIHAWIANHLLHQVVPSATEPTINLLAPRISAVHVFKIQAGYPELINQPRYFTHRHLRIDGFPATVVTTSDKSDSATILLVYIPDHSISYRVTGSGTPYNAAETDREMQAIIASFHVEKVVPANGKR
ncbi:MAG: hypothetical protein JWL77_6218 [Chthonomonadaceae bacterium]|nr:hypothetical protein [Chthonomonadaceae bacterium]